MPTTTLPLRLKLRKVFRMTTIKVVVKVDRVLRCQLFIGWLIVRFGAWLMAMRGGVEVWSKRAAGESRLW